VPPPRDYEGEEMQPLTLQQIVDDPETYASRLAASGAYAERLNVKIEGEEEGHVFVNGKYFQKDDVGDHDAYA
jgi:hypothetical protein